MGKNKLLVLVIGLCVFTLLAKIAVSLNDMNKRVEKLERQNDQIFGKTGHIF